MKKKLFVITVIMAMLACLYACGPGIPTPAETADTFLTALKEQDSETLATVYEGGELDLLDKAAESDESDEAEDSSLNDVYEEQLKPILLDFDYEISNEQINGDNASVDVKIKTYSIGEAFSAFFEDYISEAFVLAFSDVTEEELDTLASTILSKKLDELAEKDYEKSATLTMSKVDGKWMVNELETGDEIVDGLTGGLMTAFTDMTNALSAWEE